MYTGSPSRYASKHLVVRISALLTISLFLAYLLKDGLVNANELSPDVFAKSTDLSRLATLEPKVFGSMYDFSTSIAWGDIDNDGDLDLVVGTWENRLDTGNANSNKAYLNDGFGNFSLGWLADTDTETTSIALGDMDGDSDLVPIRKLIP